MKKKEFEEIERTYAIAEEPVVNRGAALGGPSFSSAVMAINVLVQEVKRLNPDFRTPGNTVPFTEEGVKKYLDKVITYWRMCDATPEMRRDYIDAYQRVRVTLFGEELPPEKTEPGEPCDQEASS